MIATADTTLQELRADRAALEYELKMLGSEVRGNSCKCFAHDDRHSSGGIYQPEPGVWKYKCGASSCGVNMDVVDLRAHRLGVGVGDVLRELRASNGQNGTHQNSNGNHRHNGNGGSKKVYRTAEELIQARPGTIAYRYTDPDSGRVDLIVIRENLPDGGKRILQAGPCEGGYSYGKPAGIQPIYNRSRIRTADSVFVVEGEKAVHALADIGVVATTSSMGAGKAAQADWSPMAGKTAYLWPDNDAPGLSHMLDVARILKGLGCIVKWIDVPAMALPPKGDAVEWLQGMAGDDAEDIARAVDGIMAGAMDKPWWADETALNAPQASTPRSNDGESPFTGPILPLESEVVPALPDEIFRGWSGAMIYAMAEHTETPPELAAVFVMGAICTAIQRKYSTRVKPGYFEPSNLYLVCALESGSRKSAVVEPAFRPVFEYEKQQAAAMADQIESAKRDIKMYEGRLKALNDRASKCDTSEIPGIRDEIAVIQSQMPTLPAVPRFVAQDITTEHLATLLERHDERMAIVSDEGGLFETMAGRYSSGVSNIDLYLQGYTGTFVRVDRGSRPSVSLSHPTLTLVNSPQPCVLSELNAKPGFRGRGLVARFLYFVPQSKLGHRKNNGQPVPERVLAAYSDGITKLLNEPMPETPNVLHLSDAAAYQWREWLAEVEDMMKPEGELAELKDWAAKLPGQTVRIASVLHCADFTSDLGSVREIPGDVMRRAILLARHYIAHARAAFGIMQSDSGIAIARDLWSIIARNKSAVFSARDAWHPLRNRFLRMTQVEPGFEVLIERNWIAEVEENGDSASKTQKRRGRPSRKFHVNHEIMKGWR